MMGRWKGRYCLRGHDTLECGRYESGGCKQCKREQSKERRASVPPKPFQRYCKRGHDTWVYGRDANLYCTSCRTDANRARERMRKLRASDEGPRHVPGLRALRESRGVSIAELAYWSQMDAQTLKDIERLRRKATHAERVRIFQALNTIEYRRREEREAEEMRRKGRMMAGLL